MTSSPHILSGRDATGLDRAGIEVRWSAFRAEPGLPRVARDGRRSVFVLSLQAVDARHAIVECFVESPSGTRAVMRRPVTCTMTHDDGLLHVDAQLDGRRVIAITCESGPAGGACRLLYAQCALLAEAGFRPGGFDPPSASLRRPESDAAAG